MCLNPRVLPNGIIRNCGVCWQCRTAYKYSVLGQAMAESLTCKHTLVFCQTYGNDDKYQSSDDNLRAKVLHYGDVQQWMKRLRDCTVGGLKYIVAGEYSPKKGRAHNHGAIFCDELPPNVVFGKNYMHSAHEKYLPYEKISDADAERCLWPHGWTFWKETSTVEDRMAALLYALKYALKSQFENDDLQQRYFGKSRSLGAEYFRQEGRRYAADLGLPVQDRWMSIGPVSRCRLTNSSWNTFLREYVIAFRQIHGHDRWPVGKLQANGLSAVEDFVSRERNRTALPDDYFMGMMHKHLGLLTERRQAAAEQARKRTMDALADRHGFRDGIDDALNFALAETITEAEFEAMFGPFEAHLERWQAEAKRRR